MTDNLSDREYVLHQFGERINLIRDSQSGATLNGQTAPEATSPTVRDAGTPSKIKVGNMGLFGDVTIPAPGKWAGRAGIFVLASIVGSISLLALLMKVPMIEKGTKAAVAATPVGAGLKAARGS